jgi:hypothetical protein
MQFFIQRIRRKKQQQEKEGEDVQIDQEYAVIGQVQVPLAEIQQLQEKGIQRKGEKEDIRKQMNEPVEEGGEDRLPIGTVATVDGELTVL